MAVVTSVQGRYSGQTGFDYPVTPVNPFAMLTLNIAGLQSDGIPVWSYYPQYRDAYLRILAKREPIMAGALYSSTSRFKSLPWKINGGRNVKKWAQSLLGEADGGAGFEQFIGKVSYDLDTQDNGAFIELVGPGRPDKPLVGRVQAIYHLDSAQCWRTFDPDYPVIYTNPLDNSYHRMHKSRVIMLSSNPQPDERARNIGFCAVSRALKMMQIIRHVETYKEEKISGKFKRALIYGNGLTPKQFDQAVERTEQASENVNFTVYNEIPVLLSMAQEMKLNMLNLAQLPDGFDYEKEINIYVNILALCFGVDAREFWPATASGATKADASIQHQKAQGKGIADKTKMIETAFNWQIFPDGCELEYDATDDEQDKAKADIDTVRITNVGLLQQQGNINAQEGRALLINQGVIDPKQLASSVDAEVADDSAPLATAENATTQPNQGQVDSFDMTSGTSTGSAALSGKDCYVLLSLANDASITAIQDKLKADYPDVEWEDPADFHVTLVYAKDATDFQQIRNILPQSINTMTFAVGPTGTFDNPDKIPLFLTVTPSPELSALQAGLAASFNSLGLELSEYSAAEQWKPHITLGYLSPDDEIPSSTDVVTVSSKSIKFSVDNEDEFDIQYITRQISSLGSKYNPDTAPGAGKFVESKHPRASNGKFGSGGSAPTPAAKPDATPTQPATLAAPPNSPIVDALISYLKNAKMLGRYKNGRLTVPGETKDRSGDLQSYLRANGFPNAKVTARQTKKGYAYALSGVEPKKPRKAKKSIKANPENHVNAYKKKLESMMSGFVDKVAANPGTFKTAVSGLQNDFLDDLPQDLTDAFGVGLAGDDPTADGIDDLQSVADKSVGYFKTSFIADLAAVSLAGLTEEGIRAALDPFVSRLGMYAGPYWESIWQGVRDVTPTSYRVKWVLEPGAQHCEDCVANEGEYDSIDEMEREVGLPGAGQTKCLGNCRCHILVEDDGGGFSSLVGSPTVFTKPLIEVN